MSFTSPSPIAGRRQNNLREHHDPVDKRRADERAENRLDERTKNAVRRRMERRDKARENDADDHAADGKAVGNRHRIEVDERGAHQKGRKKHPRERDKGRRRDEPAREKERAGQRLDGRIAEAERSMAAARMAAQDKPAKNRDIVVPGNRLAAGAVRAGPDNGFANRDAVDADVEEAADARAENKRHNGKIPRHHLLDFLKRVCEIHGVATGLGKI